MAGIRGAKNPMPVKPDTASGIFKERGPAPKKHDMAVKSAAMKCDRVNPVSRNNKLASNTSSMRSNPELKRGTSNRA